MGGDGGGDRIYVGWGLSTPANPNGAGAVGGNGMRRMGVVVGGILVMVGAGLIISVWKDFSGLPLIRIGILEIP